MFSLNLGCMSNYKYTQEQVASWVALFQTGKSYREVADVAGVPYPTVFWHVKKALGLPGRFPGRKKVHVGKTDAEIARASQLLRTYGMSPEQYEAKLKAQGGLCAICGKPPRGGRTSSKNLHVDHDHQSGEVRGLLCNRCNPALGQFDESVERLQKAIEYLQSWT